MAVPNSQPWCLLNPSLQPKPLKKLRNLLKKLNQPKKQRKRKRDKQSLLKQSISQSTRIKGEGIKTFVFFFVAFQFCCCADNETSKEMQEVGRPVDTGETRLPASVADPAPLLLLCQ
jgi:hypothetical protein